MFKKLFSATLILLFAFTTNTSTFASPKKLMPNPSENNLQEEIKTKQINLFHDLDVNLQGNLDENTIEKVINENKNKFDLNNQIKLQKISEFKDELGFTHVKFNQQYNGIPVEGQEIIAHVKNKVLKKITGQIIDNITIVKGSTSVLPEIQAVEIAKSQFQFKELRTPPTVKVVIYKNSDDNKYYQTYKINIQYNEPEIGNWEVYIDVYSGRVINITSNIRYDGVVYGNGTAVDGTTKTLILYQQGSYYYTKDITRPTNSYIQTTSANNRQTYPGNTIYSATTTINDSAGVSAHYYAGVVYQFYKNLFNRNSLDNNGMSLISTVHYGSKYNNAFWDGTQMVYGDGDGTLFRALSGDLDVVAHEMTHGVITHTANLAYKDQSGALNESLADVFGVLVQTYDKYNVANGGQWQFNVSDWVIGDDIYTPSTPNDALRSLSNPTLYNQPDHMNNYVYTSDDNGGVHINSGIPNKAAFLIAQNIGCEKTARIYYRALTTYFTSSTNFYNARLGLIQSAKDLYGTNSTEAQAVGWAFDQVGIYQTTDSYEPNDTISQAYRVYSSTSYSSYIFTPSDKDFYKIYVNNGKYMDINLTNVPGDYDLYLYNQSGTLVAYSENGYGSSERIVYKAKYTGYYYILVIGYNGSYSNTQKYTLTPYIY